MKKISFNIFALIFSVAFLATGFTSCSEGMDESNYYTFTGQMMSEYLKNNENYSQFATIVEKAGLMDQLSAYGKYTCFAPDNNAVSEYLAKKNKTIDDLSALDCDTIARTHLISAMYSISEMPEGTLDQNMMGRNVDVSYGTDENNNAIVILNGKSKIYFEHQDDSVENGIVQPINAVLENSNKSVDGLLGQDPNLKRFAEALKATGIDLLLQKKEDTEYAKGYKALAKKLDEPIATGSRNKEMCNVPKTRKYGFTIFAPKDEVLENKYHVNGLKSLYDLACSIYDSMYPEDVDKEEHDFDHLTSPINPLYRFVAYHILNRNVQGYNLLTVKQDAGIDIEHVNPTEWYSTLLPHTMLKVEKLTVATLAGATGVQGEYYLNRRYDPEHGYMFSGTHVLPEVESEEGNNSDNGYFFYVDDILKFDETTRDYIHNCRIRMDFSTIFPEIQNNNMRMSGKYISGSNSIDNGATNFILPKGYLDGVTMSDNTRFIYWYPRSGYYSMNGDEFDAQGEFDLTFNLPPVPFSGEWQIRLGCAPMNTTDDGAQFRGQVQVYFDGKAVGLPLDFSRIMSDVAGVTKSYFNSTNKYTTSIRDDDTKRQEDFKALKNNGYYRGPCSVFNSSEGTLATKYDYFADMANTVRKVLCTVTIEAGKTHTLTIKNVSTVLPKDKEAMLDYLELVPKSVWGITDGDDAEDDL